MDRAVLSQRITSILSDLNRLTNTLYALNMTDIQRYPENYEVLSTDAALRAEKITCRLRHLIYSTTNIKKEEYLASATVMQGIEIKYEDEILEITLPCLLPKRKQKQGTEFLLDPFTAALSQYAKSLVTRTAHASLSWTASAFRTGSMQGKMRLNPSRIYSRLTLKNHIPFCPDFDLRFWDMVLLPKNP